MVTALESGRIVDIKPRRLQVLPSETERNNSIIRIGSLEEIAELFDRIAYETQAKEPQGTYEIWKTIAEELPDKIPFLQQKAALVASKNKDEEQSRLGKKVFLFLNTKAILDSLRPFYTQKTDRSELDEITDLGINTVLDKIFSINSKESIPEQINAIVKESLENFYIDREEDKIVLPETELGEEDSIRRADRPGLKIKMDEALSTVLTPHEKRVLVCRFALNDSKFDPAHEEPTSITIGANKVAFNIEEYRARTAVEVAQMSGGVSHQAISETEEKALQKLRRSKTVNRTLGPYLDRDRSSHKRVEVSSFPIEKVRVRDKKELVGKLVDFGIDQLGDIFKDGPERMMEAWTKQRGRKDLIIFMKRLLWDNSQLRKLYENAKAGGIVDGNLLKHIMTRVKARRDVLDEAIRIRRESKDIDEKEITLALFIFVYEKHLAFFTEQAEALGLR